MHSFDRVDAGDEVGQGRRTVRQFAALEVEIEVDTVILGSGLTALFTALQLYKSGRRVAVLAPGELGFSKEDLQSSLYEINEPASYAKWFEQFGLNRGSLVAASYRRAHSDLRDAASRSSSAHFAEVPTLTVAEGVQELLAIERECAMGRALKGDCWFARDVPLPFRCSGASRDNSQAKVQLASLVRALAFEFQMLGGEIFEYSPCVTPPVIDRMCKVKTANGRVLAKNVVFASRVPHSLFSKQTVDLIPRHSYMISALTDQPIGDAVFVLGDNPRRMIWRSDRNDPSRVVIRADYLGDQLETQPRRFEELCCYAASRLSIKRVESKWSHHRLVSSDGLPVAGRIPHLDNAYLAVGLGASELPWAIPCGQMLAQLIEGDTPEMSSYFDPQRMSRKQVSSANLTKRISATQTRRYVASYEFEPEASDTPLWAGRDNLPGGSPRSMDFGMTAPYLQATPEESERAWWQTRPR